MKTNKDVIIILTNEACGFCSMLKGDGNLDDENTSKVEGTWWNQETFKRLTHDYNFHVLEFFYKEDMEDVYSIKYFCDYYYNPETNLVQRHKYSELDGKIGHQVDRNEQTVIEGEGKFKDILKRVLPPLIVNYFYAWPTYLFFDRENYNRSLEINGGSCPLAHVPGFNIEETSKDMYMIVKKLTNVEISIDEYAKSVSEGKVNLKELPRWIKDPDPPKAKDDDDELPYKIVGRNVR